MEINYRVHKLHILISDIQNQNNQQTYLLTTKIKHIASVYKQHVESITHYRVLELHFRNRLSKLEEASQIAYRVCGLCKFIDAEPK